MHSAHNSEKANLQGMFIAEILGLLLPILSRRCSIAGRMEDCFLGYGRKDGAFQLCLFK